MTTDCNCDLIGSLPEICDKNNGQCLCKKGYAGPRCDKCSSGYNGYPNCKPCGCSESGSASSICDASGICPCLTSFAGRTCEQCSPGYYQYPECKCKSNTILCLLLFHSYIPNNLQTVIATVKDLLEYHVIMKGNASVNQILWELRATNVRKDYIIFHYVKVKRCS